jgi:hypothetical protein
MAWRIPAEEPRAKGVFDRDDEDCSGKGKQSLLSQIGGLKKLGNPFST